jgi:hypothetical protein
MRTGRSPGGRQDHQPSRFAGPITSKSSQNGALAGSGRKQRRNNSPIHVILASAFCATSAACDEKPRLQRQMNSFSRRRLRPSCCQYATLRKQRARGRPGAGWRPWSACSKKARGRTTGAAEITRPSLRDGFTAYTSSPRGPAFLPPSPARSSQRRLDLSTGRPGPHDFAVRTGMFVRMDDHAANRRAHRVPPRVS